MDVVWEFEDGEVWLEHSDSATAEQNAKLHEQARSAYRAHASDQVHIHERRKSDKVKNAPAG